MSKFPGWRTMTAAQRYNARMDAIWEEARRLERERRAQGIEPKNLGLYPADWKPDTKGGAL